MTTFEVDAASATTAERAAFLRLALDAKLATVDEVVRWADSSVLSEARPPEWAIDLALCRTWPLHRISAALATACIDANFDVVRVLLAARLAGTVARGEFDALRAVALAWSLPLVKHDDEPFDAVTGAVFATTEGLDGVEEGWMTRERAAEIFRAAFGPLAPSEWRVA